MGEGLGYARRLARKLLEEQDRYFSRGVLNSDGRRLLEKLIRVLLEEKPWARRVVEKVRRDPTLENVVRLVRVVEED